MLRNTGILGSVVVRRIRASNAMVNPLLISRLSTTSSSVDNNNANDAIDARLREDVKTFGKILGTLIQKQDPEVYRHVENLRRQGRSVRNKLQSR